MVSHLLTRAQVLKFDRLIDGEVYGEITAKFE
jgi:hypothetical protein